jgi:hypothetical protein
MRSLDPDAEPYPVNVSERLLDLRNELASQA